MPLEVGKLAVCIKSHSEGVVKKGDVKEILGMKKEKCGCISVDVGLKDIFKAGTELMDTCTIHGDKSNDYRLPYTIITDGIWWLQTFLFAPIDNLTDEYIDEVLDKILEDNFVNI